MKLANVLRLCFWLEAGLNLVCAGLALFAPVWFLSQFTSQPGTSVTLVFVQSYGVLLGELACVEAAALLSRNNTVLLVVLLCLLVGDGLQSSVFVIFGLESLGHWPGAVIVALVVTSLLLVLRLVWMTWYDLHLALARPAPLPTEIRRERV